MSDKKDDKKYRRNKVFTSPFISSFHLLLTYLQPSLIASVVDKFGFIDCHFLKLALHAHGRQICNFTHGYLIN